MQEKSKKNEEEIEEVKEELDFTKPDYIFLPKGSHPYRQEGFYLVCRGCDLVHAVYIGGDKVLVGFNEGLPVLKNKKEIV